MENLSRRKTSNLPQDLHECVRVFPLLSAKGFTTAGTQPHQSRWITSRSNESMRALLAGCRCFMQHGTTGLSVSRCPQKGCSGCRSVEIAGTKNPALGGVWELRSEFWHCTARVIWFWAFKCQSFLAFGLNLLNDRYAMLLAMRQECGAREQKPHGGWQ